MKIVSSTRGRTAQSNDAPINLWWPAITSLKIRIKHWLSCDTDLYVTGAINKINQFTFLRVRTSLNYAEPWLAALETPVLLRRIWHFVSLFIRVKKHKQKNSQTRTIVGAHRKVKVIRMNWWQGLDEVRAVEVAAADCWMSCDSFTTSRQDKSCSDFFFLFFTPVIVDLPMTLLKCVLVLIRPGLHCL